MNNKLPGLRHRIRNKVQKLISKVTATLNFAVYWKWLMHVFILQTFWLQVPATFKLELTVIDIGIDILMKARIAIT